MYKYILFKIFIFNNYIKYMIIKINQYIYIYIYIINNKSSSVASLFPSIQIFKTKKNEFDS